jgi:hypothetical protein
MSNVHPTTGPGHPNRGSLIDDLVLTPGGWRPRSVVHLIEPGSHISGKGGRLRKIKTDTGEAVADFGAIKKSRRDVANLPGNVNIPEEKRARRPGAEVTPTLGAGWITYVGWLNVTGTPMSSFSGSWIVPPPPATGSGQTIFLFIGIQNSSYILQPVLQWGASYAGGGSYWSISNWYVDGQNGHTSVRPLVRVNPGDQLMASMSLTSQAEGSFSYLSSFAGYPEADLPATDIEELSWANVTLEAYGVQACTDYPVTQNTAFKGLSILANGNAVSPTWVPQTPVADCGQQAQIINIPSPGSEVDLYY